MLKSLLSRNLRLVPNELRRAVQRQLLTEASDRLSSVCHDTDGSILPRPCVLVRAGLNPIRTARPYQDNGFIEYRQCRSRCHVLRKAGPIHQRRDDDDAATDAEDTCCQATGDSDRHEDDPGRHLILLFSPVRISHTRVMVWHPRPKNAIRQMLRFSQALHLGVGNIQEC